MSEKSPVHEALRAEILKLAKEGDSKKEGELTPDVLQRIMRVAKNGRELLVSLDASPSNLSGMVRRPRGPFGVPYGGDMDEDLSEGSSGFAPIAPYALASPNENFGMTAIREIIAAAKNFNGNGNSPVKLVEALAIARERGLDDVAVKLEAELGMGKDKPVLPEASSAEPAVAEQGGPQA